MEEQVFLCPGGQLRVLNSTNGTPSMIFMTMLEEFWMSLVRHSLRILVHQFYFPHRANCLHVVFQPRTWQWLLLNKRIFLHGCWTSLLCEALGRDLSLSTLCMPIVVGPFQPQKPNDLIKLLEFKSIFVFPSLFFFFFKSFPSLLFQIVPIAFISNCSIFNLFDLFRNGTY